MEDNLELCPRLVPDYPRLGKWKSLQPQLYTTDSLALLMFELMT
jgi:hypothetical protein